MTFNGKDQLYWEGHSSLQQQWDAWFDAGWNEFQRPSQFNFITPTLFDSDGPHFNDIE